MENSRKKHRIFAFVATIFTSVLAIALVLSNTNIKQSLLGTKAGNSYQLVLDSSNAVSSAGDHIQSSKTGGQVTFTYSNVSASNGNHVQLNTNGTWFPLLAEMFV